MQDKSSRPDTEIMALTVSPQEGFVLAVSSGRLDDSADGVFREHLFPLLGQAGTKVVLDLSQSPYISSRGLAHLISLVARANTNSSRVILAACAPFLSIVFTRCKLDKFFETAESVEAAVQRLREQNA
jgi:anti-anti-sigma factor